MEHAWERTTGPQHSRIDQKLLQKGFLLRKEVGTPEETGYTSLRARRLWQRWRVSRPGPPTALQGYLTLLSPGCYRRKEEKPSASGAQKGPRHGVGTSGRSDTSPKETLTPTQIGLPFTCHHQPECRFMRKFNFLAVF